MHRPPRFALSLAFLLTACAGPALAQTAAAVLMVEDNDVTEDFGLAAYTPFLTRAGAYSKVYTLKGRERSNERLALAIRRAAANADMVDVFVSVHTTSRPTQTMLDLIPAEARKLRLVYSTACWGADVEREAWEQLGAKTVVTHVGLNNPVVALPFFLSHWIRGSAVRPILEAGFREEAIAARFLISLPYAGQVLNNVYGNGGASPAFLEGSRPVLSGRGDLTIRHGLPAGLKLRTPEHLLYQRRTGSSLGLVLRAMAGDYSLESGDIRSALAKLRLPDLPMLPADKIRSLRVVPREGHDGSIRAGVVELKLSERQRFPLMQGFELRVSKTVELEVGRVDPIKREIKLKTDGLWVAKGLLRYRVTSVTIIPDGQGYSARVGGGAWGVIPFWQTIPLGGTRPMPLPQDLSLIDAQDHDAQAGIATSIGLAPTQN